MNAYEIADDLLSQISESHPHVRGNGLISLALIRACGLLAAIYTSNPQEDYSRLLHGEEVRSEGEVYPPSVSPRREDSERSISAGSNVTCPNCETLNLYYPDQDVPYICSNCTYTEVG